ncbi:ABC transporter substrate-binding protein [Ruania alba]|uniref:Multiple sugar transport system substrate-binding protein n=1 Tax=Ruania alba TaxID=648782 RepID=A0A1H5MXX6_9MICO|nr:ABC transporter substrate-binding protein [Ruania alba]SEE94212.1 multiple sugar transport system substrate-binding protein [Ruania alba]
MSLNRRDLFKTSALGALTVGPGAILLSGCDTGGSPSDPDDPSGSAASEITFNNHELAESSGEFYEELMADYEAESGVHVDGNGIPFNEALNQYILQARSGSLVGVVSLGQAWIPPMAELGALQPLDDRIDRSIFQESALATVTYDGSLYAFPTTSGAIGMVCNRDLLQQAGIADLPTDIDAFTAALRALKEFDPDLIPYAAMTAAEQGKDIAAWMRTFGSDVITEDGTLTLGDAPSVETLTWYKSLYDEGLLAPNMTRFDTRPLFAQGRVAFYDDADIAPNLIRDQEADDTILEAMTPVPRPTKPGVDRPPQALQWGGGGHAVLAGDEAVVAASTDFAEWMTTQPDIVLRAFEATGRAPVLLEALEDSQFTEDEWATQWAGEIAAHARPLFESYPEGSRMGELLGQAVADVMLDAKEPQAALDEAAAEIEPLLER